MHFTTLVPNIFYPDIKDGLRLFVDCLQFKISHKELQSPKPFCVLKKEGLRINLFQDAALAQEHHPEFRLVTLNIEEVYNKVSTSHPEYLHPSLKTITLRPWGAKEFALMDKQLGIIIQEWT
ncbi:VOC family protein [Chitinophaga filiformis]|uniref:Glyoxalase-like domain-containing protein n=1 Tax=Chitinophaga filiformis TaxID=104663 RepID=A0A1G7MEP7_CHIFI|nr:hypothetical protein [Chitinophaga filiformis]SDF60171.1 hypothetical protein SAMN04488121_102395 [Chitinophaga filiformis]